MLLGALLVVLVTGCSQSADEPRAQSVRSSESTQGGTATPASPRWWVRTRPAPQDRALELMVHETACASGLPATGRVRAGVSYEPDRIVLTIAVQSAGGAQTCPGNPDTAFRLALDEPVGNRVVYDGRTSPPITAQVTYTR